MKIVILAGGKGTRLKEYTDAFPKPMINILDKTVLEYQFENLKKFNLTDIILCIGYLGDKIVEYYGDGKKFGVNIQYVLEKVPMGTGGALNDLKNIIDEDFILLFGDIIFDLDWKRFIDFHKAQNGLGTFLVHPNSHPYDSDLMLLDDKLKIKEISYKNSRRGYYKNIVKSGIHIFKKEILNFVEEGRKQDLEKHIISKALENDNIIYAYKTSEYVKDMGTYERLQSVEKDLLNNILEKKALYSKQKCIFLDRDGTINKLKGLLYKIEDFELESNSAEAIKLINNSGFLCIMITNQPVIARNLCTIEELDSIHKKMETLLGEKGAYLDDIYYCPHHPDGGYDGENKEYKIKCHCRKPDIGMIDETVKKYNIDIENSYIIGDTTIDIKTGINTGLHTVLVKTGEAGNDGKFKYAIPEIVADNLYEAVKLILQKEKE
jgi:histidinol-phosphate phosphatase family domain/HAD-superfamily hydrolase, subfamily IIIA